MQCTLRSFGVYDEHKEGTAPQCDKKGSMFTQGLDLFLNLKEKPRTREENDDKSKKSRV